MEYINFFRNSDSSKLMKEYHNLSDKRNICSIPNFMDVSSNLIFLIPAWYAHKVSKKDNFWTPLLLILAFSSAYYHISPNQKTIFIDQLSVITVYILTLSYFIKKDYSIALFLLGLFSVFYGKFTKDLRLYELLKIIIPIALVMYLYKTSMKHYIPLILIIGLASRFVEYNDKRIFNITNKKISGHTLKHVLSGALLMILIYTLHKLDRL